METKKYEDLWALPSDTEEETTDHIPEIMRAQEEYLSERTHGKVHAAFTELHITTSVSDQLASISAPFNAPRKTIRDPALQVAIEGLRDAGPLYRTRHYEFEIYTDIYRFRVFEMRSPPWYPVSIFVDEDVSHDIDSRYRLGGDDAEGELVVGSDAALQAVLRQIFTCRKVVYIYGRLEKMGDPADARRQD